MNGLLWKPYTYNGTGEDTLTAWMDDEPDEEIHRGRQATQPCGTTTAYRRHLRRGEKPCEACKQAERRRWADRSGPIYAERSERYHAARDAGMSRDQAKAVSSRRTAA